MRYRVDRKNSAENNVIVKALMISQLPECSNCPPSLDLSHE